MIDILDNEIPLQPTVPEPGPANGARRPTRIVIVDPHPYTAEGLRALLHVLTDDLEVVAIGHQAAALAEQIRAQRPGLLIVEPRLPGMLAALRVATQTSPDIRILALTSHEDRRQAQQVLKAGARGYISKEVEPSDLIAAVRVVLSGRVVLSEAASSALLDPENGSGGLSTEDRTLLRLIIEGLDNTEMARRLMVSESTLKRNVHRLLKTLKARNRVEAAVRAASQGLLDEA